MSSKRKRQAVDVALFKAALRLSKYETPNQLAEATGISHVAIGKILSGETKHPHRPTLETLESALQIPPGWLMNRARTLSFMRTPMGYDEEGFPMYPTSYEDLQLVHLVEARFLTRCYDALIRDLEQRYGDRKKAEAAYYDDKLWLILEGSMRGLVNIAKWRRKFFPDRPKKVVRAPRGRIAIAPRVDEGVEALAKAFEIILAPWLERADVKLDLRAVFSATANTAALEKAYGSNPHD